MKCVNMYFLIIFIVNNFWSYEIYDNFVGRNFYDKTFSTLFNFNDFFNFISNLFSRVFRCSFWEVMNSINEMSYSSPWAILIGITFFVPNYLNPFKSLFSWAVVQNLFFFPYRDAQLILVKEKNIAIQEGICPLECSHLGTTRGK